MALMRLGDAFLARPILFFGAGVAAVMTIACIVAIAMYEMRMDASARARELAGNISLVLKRDIERNIEIYELSIEALVDGDKDGDISRLLPKIRQFVRFNKLSNAGETGSLLITNAVGDVAIDSRPAQAAKFNLANRDYFQVQRQSASAGLYIGRPFRSQLREKDLSIGLSERLEDAEGRFKGIVVGMLGVNYFRRLFEGITLGPRDSITLVRTDGVVLMRRPYREEDIGSSVAGASSFKPLVQADEGDYISKSSLDAVQRLYAFKRIGKYPLAIVVGLATDDIYAQWKRRAWVIGGVMGILIVLFTFMIAALAKQFRKRLETEQKLQMLVDTDDLTGLGSRRALDGALNAEWRRTKRSRRILAMLMVDVDNFKAFNDHYGHVAGDRALRIVAGCIVENIRRPADFAGRYGGEEFCVLLPHTDLMGAVQVAEAIRRAVLATNQLHVGCPSGQVSVSVGVAAFDGDAASGMTTEQLVRETDRRLYEAKAAGRNTVHY
jgi:diguanylate cyclase (GGDEF)-like protein